MEQKGAVGRRPDLTREKESYIGPACPASQDRHRRILTLSAALLAASVAACAMILIRYIAVGWPRFQYLVWNLFLAWIPYITAAVIHTRIAGTAGNPRYTPALGFLAFLWLLFYPNAPYIFTDFIHLINTPYIVVPNRLVTNREVLLWYDLIVTGSFAWIGHFLGLISLYLVHDSLERLTGRTAGWIVISSLIGLSGFGVFLGRFIRLNSWHVFTQPLETLKEIVPYLTSFNSFAFSSAFATFILLTYLPAYAVGRRFSGGGQVPARGPRR